MEGEAAYGASVWQPRTPPQPAPARARDGRAVNHRPRTRPRSHGGQWIYRAPCGRGERSAAPGGCFAVLLRRRTHGESPRGVPSPATRGKVRTRARAAARGHERARRNRNAFDLLSSTLRGKPSGTFRTSMRRQSAVVRGGAPAVQPCRPSEKRDKMAEAVRTLGMTSPRRSGSRATGTPPPRTYAQR